MSGSDLMEKKTIGSFIATLRKANGLTQKQLAEKLCVSDKAVSRWERDETMPDLSLIPVIAEIFGVTTDELLRGQRKDPEAPAANWEAQTQLQYRRLIKDAKTKYSTRSIISVGIALIGLITALICNYGFLNSYLGFGIGCAFCALGLVLQVVFTVQAHSAVDDEDLDAELLRGCNNHFYKLCTAVVTVIALIVAFLSPMALWGDPYWSVDNLLTFENTQLCVISVAVCLVCAWLLAVHLTNKGVLSISQRTVKLNNLRLRCIAIAIGLCLLLFLGLNLLVNMLFTIDLPMTGTVADDYIYSEASIGVAMCLSFLLILAVTFSYYKKKAAQIQ